MMRALLQNNGIVVCVSKNLISINVDYYYVIYSTHQMVLMT